MFDATLMLILLRDKMPRYDDAMPAGAAGAAITLRCC